MKEHQKALSILDKLLSYNPREPEWNYYKAFCLQHIGQDLNEAVEQYTKALENGYKEFWVRYNRGILYKSMGDLEKAQTDIQRAISIEPAHEGASKILLEIQEAELKEHDKSIPIIFEEDISRVRDLVYKNEYQKAIQLLEDVLKKFPVHAESNYLYAFCLHIQKRNLTGALYHYNLALNNGFDEYWVKYNRGSLLAQLGDLDNAREDIKRALELKPNDVGASSVLERIEAM